MPEGPEVRLVAKDLNSILKDKYILRVLYLKDKVTRGQFKDEVLPLALVKVVFSHGKQTFILTDHYLIVVHLGMGGGWSFENVEKTEMTFLVAEKWEEDYKILGQLHYYNHRFGRVTFLNCSELKDYIMSEMGPDLLQSSPLIEDWMARWNEFKKRFSRWKICEALLEQRLYAGIGNYLKDEILYALAWHPARTVDTLTEQDLLDLHEVALRIINEAYDRGGTTIRNYRRVDGREGGFQHFLKVYGKTTCPSGHLLNRNKFSDRTSTWCNICQWKQ
jgi:formamidopyrimidine-DNA glycosylase